MLPVNVEWLMIGGGSVLVAVAALAFLIAFPRAVRETRRERALAERRRVAAGASAAAPAARPEPLPAPPAPVTAEPAAPAPVAPVEPVPEPPRPRREPDLEGGLRKSRNAFVGRLRNLLRGRGSLDAETLEEVEAILFGADLGVRTADDLLQAARAAGDPGRVTAALEEHALGILRGLPDAERPLADAPHVILVVGVNGSGKTTSIGKLAHLHVAAGRSVLVAAGDTYRAAAIEQLAVWADRAGAEIVKGTPGGDPASVAFDAVKAGRSHAFDVVLIDTAGRLQTDQNLMDQLAKIRRVIQKEVPEAPHEVLLVLDGNTGQNAIRQAQEFTRSVDVTGIVLTKLDGTAKGGVVLGIAQEVGLPVRYVGLGEGIDDLYDFDPERFVRALFAASDDD